MSEYSGVFDQLADALKAAGASRPRHPRSARRHPASPRTAAREPSLVPARPPRQVDRSRDRAFYAAPHRPTRPHFHSRPDDIVTERITRAAPPPPEAPKPSRAFAVVAIAFSVTVAFGALGAVAFTLLDFVK